MQAQGDKEHNTRAKTDEQKDLAHSEAAGELLDEQILDGKANHRDQQQHNTFDIIHGARVLGESSEILPAIARCDRMTQGPNHARISRSCDAMHSQR